MGADVWASASDLQLWHVQMPGGAVRTMTLDELDDAFQNGVIDERTMVLASGSLHWTTLGDAAGIDASPSFEAQPSSIAPVATDLAPSCLSIAPLPPPSLDVAIGTDELAAIRPKRHLARAIGVLAVVGAFAAVLFGAQSQAPVLRAKAASLATLVKGKTNDGARAAAVAPPPAVDPLPAPATAPPMVNARTVAIDSLPAAPAASPNKAEKKAGAAKKPAKAKKRKKGESSSDPSQRGGAPFDPLDGTL